MCWYPYLLRGAGAWRVFGGRGCDGRGVGRVASRVNCCCCCFGRWMGLGHRWLRDLDICACTPYIVIVPLSHEIQVIVLSVVRAVSNRQRDSSSSIRGCENCYTCLLSRYPILSRTYSTIVPIVTSPAPTVAKPARSTTRE